MKIVCMMITLLFIIGMGVAFAQEPKGSQCAVSEATVKYDKQAVKDAMLKLIHDNGDTIVVDLEGEEITVRATEKALLRDERA